jgi:hypothetical protein
MKNLNFKKYRGTDKGHFKIPWMFYDGLPQWLQNHQREVFKRDLSLAECLAAVRRMQQISDAARRASKFDQIIIKHDAATDRWASYGTSEDRVILEAKGHIKPGSYADRMRGVEACSRSQMLEHIVDRFECGEKEAVRLFNVFKSKANNTIRFDSKKDGYGDTWRSWDVRPKAPSRVTQETMIAGTRCDEYRKLVAGINKKRHNYKEPLEASEFLQALDARVVETGFALDIKEGKSRYAALDALRNRMWNVTKQEELKPLTGLRQPDGAWLLSAQTESQAEQEAKKVQNLATAEDIDFQSFREWWDGASFDDYDQFVKSGLSLWNVNKKEFDKLADKVEDAEIAEREAQKKAEEKEKSKAQWQLKNENSTKAKQVLGKFKRGRIDEGNIACEIFNSTDGDTGLVSAKRFTKLIVSPSDGLDRYEAASIIQTLSSVINFTEQS